MSCCAALIDRLCHHTLLLFTSDQILMTAVRMHLLMILRLLEQACKLRLQVHNLIFLAI